MMFQLCKQVDRLRKLTAGNRSCGLTPGMLKHYEIIYTKVPQSHGQLSKSVGSAVKWSESGQWVSKGATAKEAKT